VTTEPDPASSARLSCSQAAALLRQIIDGRLALRLKNPRRPWVQVAVGECEMVAGDTEFVFFADSATLDHLVRASGPSGAPGEFGQWLAEGGNPVDLLDDGERLELEHILNQAS